MHSLKVRSLFNSPVIVGKFGKVLTFTKILLLLDVSYKVSTQKARKYIVVRSIHIKLNKIYEVITTNLNDKLIFNTLR